MSRPKKRAAQRANRLKKIGKRLAAYSAAAAATVLTAQGTANAADVVWPIPDVTVGAQPGLLFNLITGATSVPAASLGNSVTGSFRIASYSGSFPYIAGPAYSNMAGFVGPGSFTAGVNIDASNLNASSSVGVGNNFAANTDYPSYGNFGYLSQNFTNNRGFVGLQFDIGASLHYGWAEVTHLGAGQGITLHGFGYNSTAGAPSHPVPEPSSILLLATGAAGLAGWRRRRSRKAA